MQVTHKRRDGTFEIIHNGWPYHVIPGDPLWDEVLIAGANAPWEEIPPEPSLAERLAGWRATKSMTKADFLYAVANAGWITDADAIDAARGIWPSGLDGFLLLLTDRQARDIKIEWAARLNMDRMHPDVAALAWWMGKNDAEVDALFGWQV